MWGFLTAALTALMQLITAGKWKALGLVLVGLSSGGLGWAGKTYVDEKHEVGLAKVKENAVQIKKLSESQAQVATAITLMKNNLQTMTTVMRDVKKAVGRVDDTNRDVQKTVVDIYRDVYQIKLKQAQNGG